MVCLDLLPPPLHGLSCAHELPTCCQTNHFHQLLIAVTNQISPVISTLLILNTFTGKMTLTKSHVWCMRALFPGLPRWAGTRKVKPIWILLKQETVSGNEWHQLGHMQVCTSLQIDNHASTPPLRFLQAGCSSCRPTNSVKALKETSTK